MTVGFFLVLRADVGHFLHAAALVREVRRCMPGVDVVQFSDDATPMVPEVMRVQRIWPERRSLLDQRLEHYATCAGEWLLVDTDVSLRNDIRGVFHDEAFDVALCDREWPQSPQSVSMLQAMPFNTGVMFCRSQAFLSDVYRTWLALPQAVRGEWMSEQRAVYDVVKTGRYRVKILPGVDYNYPPAHAKDLPITAALVHFKGKRKAWRSALAYQELGA